MADAKYLSAEDALRNLVSVIDVDVPTAGIGEGKVILWGLAGPNQRMGLCVACNSYEEAHLNAIWRALNEAKRTLGLPFVEPDPSMACIVQQVNG